MLKSIFNSIVFLFLSFTVILIDRLYRLRFRWKLWNHLHISKEHAVLNNCRSSLEGPFLYSNLVSMDAKEVWKHRRFSKLGTDLAVDVSVVPRICFVINVQAVEFNWSKEER